MTELSRPDKVLWPDAGVTKADLAQHYEHVADVLLPHLQGRPLVVHRFPDGIDDSGFYQKQVPDSAPDFVDTVDVHADTRRGHVEHIVVDGVETLDYLANQACLELHRWLSRTGALDDPDQLVIDLDPPDGGDLDALRRAARSTRDLFEAIGLVPYLMATGGKGYHVVAPLDGTTGFDDVRALARAIADRLVDEAPDDLTVEQRIDARGDRIFVDTNRNAYAQTAITPYSPRARPGAPVATPIDFAELGRTRPDGYDMTGIRRRLARKTDPWQDMHTDAVSADTARRALDSLD